VLRALVADDAHSPVHDLRADLDRRGRGRDGRGPLGGDRQRGAGDAARAE